jgi:hypothetical protein
MCLAASSLQKAGVASLEVKGRLEGCCTGRDVGEEGEGRGRSGDVRSFFKIGVMYFCWVQVYPSYHGARTPGADLASGFFLTTAMNGARTDVDSNLFNPMPTELAQEE